MKYEYRYGELCSVVGIERDMDIEREEREKLVWEIQYDIFIKIHQACFIA